MKCRIQNTNCPFQTVNGCYYAMHNKLCAITSGIDLALYASQTLEMTTHELSMVRRWCCDMRDLLVDLQYCPITMIEVNEIDSITVDRMQTGYFIRQHGQVVLQTNVPHLVLLNSKTENSKGHTLGSYGDIHLRYGACASCGELDKELTLIRLSEGFVCKETK